MTTEESCSKFVMHKDMRGPLWVALILVTLVPMPFLGCSGDEQKNEDSVVAVAIPSTAELSSAEKQSNHPSLGPGEFRISVHEDGTISAFANAAPRLAVLLQLAKDAEFLLEIHALSWETLTTELADVTLRSAVPVLVGDAEYQAEWLFDPDTNQHQLLSLTVGTDPMATPIAADIDSDVDTRIDPQEAAAQADESMIVKTLPEVLTQRRAMNIEQSELRKRLKDPDPRVRMEAAIEIEPEEEGLTDLVDLLLNDPNPGVRAAATVSLENTDQIAGVNALVDALNDPNPMVVVEVLNSIEFAGDESLVSKLAPLLGHTDPRVRDAAAEAMDYLSGFDPQ